MVMARRRPSDPFGGMGLLVVLGLIGLVLVYWWVIAAVVIGWYALKALTAWWNTGSARQRVRASQILPSVSLVQSRQGPSRLLVSTKASDRPLNLVGSEVDNTLCPGE